MSKQINISVKVKDKNPKALFLFILEPPPS